MGVRTSAPPGWGEDISPLITEVACVQNGYNLADRPDQRLFDSCATDGVPASEATQHRRLAG
jgi:hypothetical protein